MLVLMWFLMSLQSSANKVNVFKCNDGEDLDDATFEMGDQQLLQITGGSQM